MLSVLQREKILSVRQLAKLIYASDSSVRRDINSLERAGCMIKTYGSIMLAEYKTGVVPVCFREKSDSPEKEQAAKEAAAQIFEGATVFWDALSTVRRVRKYLNSLDQLTVITNDLQIFEEFSNPKISLYCTGGRYDPPKNKVFFFVAVRKLLFIVFLLICFSARQFLRQEKSVIAPKREQCYAGLCFGGLQRNISLRCFQVWGAENVCFM